MFYYGRSKCEKSWFSTFCALNVAREGDATKGRRLLQEVVRRKPKHFSNNTFLCQVGIGWCAMCNCAFVHFHAHHKLRTGGRLSPHSSPRNKLHTTSRLPKVCNS